MTVASRLEGDLYVKGVLRALDAVLPDGCIDDDAVSASAAIVATKMEHQYTVTMADDDATTCADRTAKVHTVYGATGTLVSFEACATAKATGTDKVEIDLTVNGVSALNAVIELNTGDANDAIVVGTISSATLADGDMIRIDFDATAGDGALPTGVSATLVWREDAV